MSDPNHSGGPGGPTDGGATEPPDGSGDGGGGGGDDAAEFARLKPARPRRSPIVAASVILVGGMLLVHLRDDLRYAISSSSPTDLGDARRVAAGDLSSLPVDRYVSLGGIPDYRNALVFDPKGDQYRRAFFRLLGTDTRLVVRADETSTRARLDEKFVGRLRRFDDIPYGEQVRRYYAEKVHATRFVDLEVLRARIKATGASSLGALASRDGGLTDLTDEQVRTDASTPATLVASYPDDLKITLSRDKFAVEEDARHEVERLGKAILGPPVETRDAWSYLVRVTPPERNAYIAKLDERDIGFALHQERVTTTLGEIAVGAEGQALVARGVTAPFAQIASLQVEAPVLIPHDARILVENEAPGDFLWAPIVAGMLLLFILFNVWVLAASLRRPARS